MTIRINRFTADIKDKALELPMSIKLAKSPVLSYAEANSRNVFEAPEYDLNQLNTIEDTEAYVRQAHRKKVGLGFKEGWDFVGRNPEVVAYIKTRMAQLELAQNKPWRLLLKEVFHDLVIKSNAYLVKVRNQDISGGSSRQFNGKTLQPVAAYFIMAPETVEISRDQSGKVSHYRQVTPSGTQKEYKADDVVHFYIDKKTGFAVGTPILTPVIDDIRTLRRIEENIDLLIYQNLFPLFHYSVGSEQMPAQYYPDGTSELDTVRTELEYMPPEGFLVTPERHKIEMVGAEGRALKAETYLKHFKERVFSGLGVSAVDMGEGATANRSTADTLSDNIRDDVKSIQDDLEAQFDFYVIRELLLEGDLKDVNTLEDKNVVHLQFKEIDKEAKIALENHVAQMYSQHLINEDEARAAIGRDPVDVEDEEYRKKTYWKLIQEPQYIIQAVDQAYLTTTAIDNPQLAIDEKSVQEGQARAETTEVKKTEPRIVTKNRGEASGASRNTPSNQQGVRTGPKLSKDNFIQSSFNELIEDILAYKQTETSNEWIKKVVLGWSNSILEKMKRQSRLRFYDGFRTIYADPFRFDLAGPVASTDAMVTKYVTKLSSDLESRLDKFSGAENKSEVMSIIEINNNRLNGIYETERQRAYNYGRLVAFKHQDALVKFSASECPSCKEFGDKSAQPARNLSIEDIPPHHPFCECTVIKG